MTKIDEATRDGVRATSRADWTDKNRADWTDKNRADWTDKNRADRTDKNRASWANKEEQIKELSDKFARSKGAFIVDFKGIRVEQMTNLRKKLHRSESEMKVVRNTLARRAFANHQGASLVFGPSTKGTNAIVFSYGEMSVTAKAISEFAREVELLQIKTGVMDSEVLDLDKIKFLATLPGKDQLRAQLLAVFKEPAAKMARVLDSYVKKKTEEA